MCLCVECLLCDYACTSYARNIIKKYGFLFEIFLFSFFNLYETWSVAEIVFGNLHLDRVHHHLLLGTGFIDELSSLPGKGEQNDVIVSSHRRHWTFTDLRVLDKR